MATIGGRAWFLGAVAGLAAFAGGRSLLASDELDAFTERARVHYANVERELEAADVSALTPARREARARAIGSLHAYRVRGDFGRNREFPGARVPYFVDGEGRRCAVAAMLHADGEDDVVGRVAAAANHAWVADLAGDAEFRAWLDRSGLSLVDAARIQGPSFSARFKGPPPPPPNNIDVGSKAKDDGSAGGRSNGSSSQDQSGAAVAEAGSTSRGARSSQAGADAGSWWLWWECNKLDHLTAHPLRLGGAKATETAIAARRADAARVFTASLADPNPLVRSAAVVALGRVAGESSVERIVPLLRDADRLVRERAILALGATGSAAGADVLLDIARGRDDWQSAEARAVAVLALSISQRYGLAKPFDAQIAALVRDAKKHDLADLGSAALIHRILVACPDLDAEAIRAAIDVNAPAPERARAIESLGTLRDRRAAATLRNAVGDCRVDARRSAAIALGDVTDPLSVAQLKTAYEFETEPLTRGFLLLSLGRAGGLTALDFLRAELAKGPEAMRPWAALGLGQLARADGDIEALAALRTADLPPSARGAVWIARGLGRDASAVPALAKALAEAASPAERADAATALALVADEDAHAALLAACERERSEYVRVVAAWGLGSMGRDADAPALLATVEQVDDPDLAVVAAVALGFHGGEACLDGAITRATDAKLPAAGRAAAIDAAGLMLSRSEGLVLHEVSRRTNFTVMPRWLRSALGVTL